MTHSFDRLVLEAGGATSPRRHPTHAAARYLGEGTLARFAAIKARCDPNQLLQTELYRRLLAPAAQAAPAAAEAAEAPAWRAPERAALPASNGAHPAPQPTAASGNGQAH
jgi:hypothetical protein